MPKLKQPKVKKPARDGAPITKKKTRKPDVGIRINADEPKAIVLEVVTHTGKVIATSNKTYRSLKPAQNAVDAFANALLLAADSYDWACNNNPEEVPVKQTRTKR